VLRSTGVPSARMQSVEGSDSDHWLGVLSDSDELLAELSDSPDPVAQRQIRDALYAKGKALSGLARPSEAVEVWDELLRRLAVEPSSTAQRIVLRVLLHKAIDLVHSGEQVQAVNAADAVLTLSASVDQPDLVRWQVLAALLLKGSVLAREEREAAAAICTEIIHRFADSDNAVIHEQVTAALVRMGVLRLLENEADDAIRLSPALAERLENAPEDVLAAEADLATVYGRCLIGFAGTDLWAMTGALAFISVNIAIGLWTACVERLNGLAAAPPIKPPRHRSLAYSGRVMPTGWQLARRRIEAAIELQERVVSRIGIDPDPELQRVAIVARIQTVGARMVLGDLRQGWRELSPLLDSSDPATIQALQSIAANLRGRSDLLGQLDELSTLSWRAQALGQGDVKIERIAYEDSIKPLLADTTHRSVRWLAALLRPDREILAGLPKKAKAAARKVIPRLRPARTPLDPS
jgi:hypothetical protein